VLKLDGRKGVLAAGFDADLAVLDSDLAPEMTFSRGRMVYRRG
jgi:beta-aspartyl-dipeptidase (metallo-type)